MPCIQVNVVNNQAILSVILFPPGTMREKVTLQEESIKIPNTEMSICQFLIDTGATKSCLSKHIAEKAKLIPSGRAKVQSVHEIRESNTYLVDTVLIDIQQGFENIELLEVNLPENSKYQGLIGMDIISRGTLHFNYGVKNQHGVCTFCI